MASSGKPYVITDARTQAEDIDLMFAELYDDLQALDRTVTGGLEGIGEIVGARGVPGRDGEDADVLWMPQQISSAVGCQLGSTNVWTGLSNQFAEIISVDKGLQFPVTQAASTTANVLDDYEEGTWTPLIAGTISTSGQTYNQQIGHYVKIGQLVVVTFDVALSVKGTIGGNVIVSGFPFTLHATAQYPTHTFRWINTVTSYMAIVSTGESNGTFLNIYASTATVTSLSTALVTADIADTTRFIGSLSYRATA